MPPGQSLAGFAGSHPLKRRSKNRQRLDGVHANAANTVTATTSATITAGPRTARAIRTAMRLPRSPKDALGPTNARAECAALMTLFMVSLAAETGVAEQPVGDRERRLHARGAQRARVRHERDAASLGVASGLLGERRPRCARI